MRRLAGPVALPVELDLADTNGVLHFESFKIEFTGNERFAGGVSERVVDLRLVELVRKFEFGAPRAMNGDNLASIETLRADAEAGVDDGRRRGDIEGEAHRGRPIGDWGLDLAGRLGSWPLDREGLDLSAFPSARGLDRRFLDRLGLLLARLLGRCVRRRRDHNQVGLIFLRMAQLIGGRLDLGARGWAGLPCGQPRLHRQSFCSGLCLRHGRGGRRRRRGGRLRLPAVDWRVLEKDKRSSPLMDRERIVSASAALGIDREETRFLGGERKFKIGDFGWPAGNVDTYLCRAAKLSGAIGVGQADPKPAPHAFNAAVHDRTLMIGGCLCPDCQRASRERHQKVKKPVHNPISLLAELVRGVFIIFASLLNYNFGFDSTGPPAFSQACHPPFKTRTRLNPASMKTCAPRMAISSLGQAQYVTISLSRGRSLSGAKPSR